jgi:CDP-diacylglycerol--glycerol-3-phosphate 3-phosphatidyltransferase
MSTRGGIRSARFLAASTTARILLTPVIMGLLIADASEVVAAVLFAVAAATDWFDGYLARRWDVTTKLGSFLDTTADKLLVTGVLIALVAVERASPWIAVIIIGRELVILGLRGVIAAEGTVMQPSLLGKLKTSVQFLAILLAILRPGDPIGGAYLDEWAMLVAAVITVMSAVEYLTRFGSIFSTSQNAPRSQDKSWHRIT